MALDKTTLKASFKSAFLANYPGGGTAEQIAATDALAGAMADAMDLFVKSGAVSVTVPFPIPVVVAIPAGTGGTTATAIATGNVT